MPRPLPRIAPPPLPAMAAAAFCPSDASERGLRTVSSTDMTKHAASVAACKAFYFTNAGSQTYASYVSTMSPVWTSKP